MKATIWKNYYDIVILPPKPVMKYAIQLSRRARKCGRTKLVLGARSFIPHISLYHIPVKATQRQRFLDTIHKVSQRHSGGTLRITGLKLFKPHRSLLLMANKPAWLDKLCRDIVRTTQILFDKQYDVRATWQIAKLSKGMQAKLKQYGSPVVGRYFMPHITLTGFLDDEGMRRATRQLKAVKMKWQVSDLYICELGQFHSCQRIVAKIKLGV